VRVIVVFWRRDIFLKDSSFGQGDLTVVRVVSSDNLNMIEADIRLGCATLSVRCQEGNTRWYSELVRAKSTKLAEAYRLSMMLSVGMASSLTMNPSIM
jgi:hypothetical protein